MADPSTNVPDYSFDPFARHQFYVDINASLVRRAISYVDMARPSGQRLSVVELASGTGAVTEQILDVVTQCGRNVTLVAIEPSADALVIARERLRAAADWLDDYRRFWETGFDRLDEHLRQIQSRDTTRDTTRDTKGARHE